MARYASWTKEIIQFHRNLVKELSHRGPTELGLPLSFSEPNVA